MCVSPLLYEESGTPKNKNLGEKKIRGYASSIRNENPKIHWLNPKFSGNETPW
jgi:hypothetical protein